MVTMIATTALTLAFLAAAPAGPPPSRLLLCRSRVIGDPGQARADALPAAARAIRGRFLDYGVACDDVPEAVRAARRAGLDYALTSSAEARAEGTSYVLSVAEVAVEREVARREIAVAATEDAVAPLERALRELVSSPGPAPSSAPRSFAPWVVTGAGVAALAAGGAFALAAGSAASARDRAGAAADYGSYIEKDAAWHGWRTASGIALGVGGAVLAAGLAWRFAF
jgi:hypothetical protein